MLLLRLAVLQHNKGARLELLSATGAVRGFIPAPANGVNDAAPLTITGLAEAGRHVVVKLDTWEAHAPIAMIPLRSGETATLQVPLGR